MVTFPPSFFVTLVTPVNPVNLVTPRKRFFILFNLRMSSFSCLSNVSSIGTDDAGCGGAEAGCAMSCRTPLPAMQDIVKRTVVRLMMMMVIMVMIILMMLFAICPGDNNSHVSQPPCMMWWYKHGEP